MTEHRRRHQLSCRLANALGERPGVDALGKERNDAIHPLEVILSDVIGEIGETGRRGQGVVGCPQKRQSVEWRTGENAHHFRRRVAAAGEHEAGERHSALGDQRGGEDRVGPVRGSDHQRARAKVADQFLGGGSCDQRGLHANGFDVPAMEDFETEALGNVDHARRAEPWRVGRCGKDRNRLEARPDLEPAGAGKRRGAHVAAIIDQNPRDGASAVVAVLLDGGRRLRREHVGVLPLAGEDRDDVGGQRTNDLDVEPSDDLKIGIRDEAFDHDDIAAFADLLDLIDDLFHKAGELPGSNHFGRVIEGDRIRRLHAA